MSEGELFRGKCPTLGLASENFQWKRQANRLHGAAWQISDVKFVLCDLDISGNFWRFEHIQSKFSPWERCIWWAKWTMAHKKLVEWVTMQM